MYLSTGYINYAIRAQLFKSWIAIQLLNNWALISAIIDKKVLLMVKITLNTVIRYSHCNLSWRLR